jgi:hypothetical protein
MHATLFGHVLAEIPFSLYKGNPFSLLKIYYLSAPQTLCSSDEKSAIATRYGKTRNHENVEQSVQQKRAVDNM